METIEVAPEQELLKGLQSGDPKPVTGSFWQYSDAEFKLSSSFFDPLPDELLDAFEGG
jgi:hypothetical protein